jgi:predicted nucleotide-binding protein
VIPSDSVISRHRKKGSEIHPIAHKQLKETTDSSTLIIIMVDAVLVTTSCIFGILILIASIYFLVYFQHPDDKWVAWLPKLVVVCFEGFIWHLSLFVSNLFKDRRNVVIVLQYFPATT